MLHLELGEDVEAHITEAAQKIGVTLDSYVRERVKPQGSHLPAAMDIKALELRGEAIRKLMNFAKDNNIHLPDSVSVDDLRREARP